ncbi:MAG: hypothetical protein VX589_15000 [Myxococcota bacterium]|nr:hypothetical protein [Myxococcota bacterium]
MLLRLVVLGALLAAGIWLLQRPPIRTPTATSTPSDARPAPLAALPRSTPTPPPISTRRSPDAPAPPPPSFDATVEAVDARPQPRGPFFVPLGRHTIYLRDPQQKRRIQLSLTGEARTAAGQAQVRRSKQRLVRMLFFLASRRNPDAAERPDARERLERDLYERFSKIVPGYALVGLTIDAYEVVSASKPSDAGTTP